MAETLEVVEEQQIETVTPPSPFNEESWKAAPTVAVVDDPVIKEKDEKVKEEKPTSDKPNEPEKIPGASPKPIQEREKEEEKQATSEFKFANEESEKVFNLLKEGKTSEVLNVLSEQKKLSEVDKLTPAEIVKLNLQYQNKDFSQKEINDLFEETYQYPEKPVFDEITETEDEFKKREEAYNKQVEKIENRIARDSKPAKAELTKLHKEIVLPDIPKQEPVIIEPTQEELDAQKKEVEKFLLSVDEGLKNFSGYNATFKDEEVEIPVAYKLTEDEKKEIQPLIALSNTNAAEFLKNIGWLDANGNISTSKLLEDLPFILNKEKVLQKFVTETGNKRHEASIKSIKNIDYSGKVKTNGDIGTSPQQEQEKLVTHFFRQ